MSTPRGIQTKTDQSKLLTEVESGYTYKIIENTEDGRILQSALESLDDKVGGFETFFFTESLTATSLSAGNILADTISATSISTEYLSSTYLSVSSITFGGETRTIWTPQGSIALSALEQYPPLSVVANSANNIAYPVYISSNENNQVFMRKNNVLTFDSLSAGPVNVNDCDDLGFEYYRNGFNISEIQTGINRYDWDWTLISQILTRYIFLDRDQVVSWTGSGKFANISQTMNSTKQFTFSGSGWTAEEAAYEIANFKWVFTFELDLGILSSGGSIGVADLLSMGWHPSNISPSEVNAVGSYVGSFIPIYDNAQSMKFTLIQTPAPNAVYQLSFFGFGVVGGVTEYKAGSYALRVKMNRVPRTFLTLS